MEASGSSGRGPLTFRQTLVIFIGLQLGQVMSSIDGTIVATALPTIADDIGGFSRSTWVVSAYALAMVASMPLYGKLGDLYGRRRVLLVAIGMFLVGSMACGVGADDGPAARRPGSSRASAAAGSAPSPWRRSPTSSRLGSSAAGSGTRG